MSSFRETLGWLYHKTKQLLKMPWLKICGNKVNMTANIESGVIMRQSNIGNYVYIGPRASVLWADIGNYSCIAGGVGIGGMNHEYKRHYSINPLLNPFCHMDERIHIGRDVWIGSKCVILQGVTIGDGAIVGAGSVVTKDVPENTIVVGVPAKFYRKRFPDDVWEKIKSTNFWDYNPIMANKVLNDLGVLFPKD